MDPKKWSDLVNEGFWKRGNKSNAKVIIGIRIKDGQISISNCGPALLSQTRFAPINFSQNHYFNFPFFGEKLKQIDFSRLRKKMFKANVRSIWSQFRTR